MRIATLQDTDATKWDQFVLGSEMASVYHLTGWRDVIERSFGHRTHYLMAMEGDEILGILPLVFMKSILFGRSLVSLPFFNYGGIYADRLDIRQLLLQEAVGLANREKASYIELRHYGSCDLGLRSKTAKVAMILALPSTAEELWSGFRPKLRSQIRRAEREGMEVRLGGVNLLDGFYRVFSTNMRDLGTPVYPKAFFRNIIETFPTASKILTILYKQQPVASGFLVASKGKVEIPWASSLRQYNPLAPNMLLYWQSLKNSCDCGYAQFDFGRSTIESPTYKFKQQWGARPLQLHWDYWLPAGSRLPEISPSNPKYRLRIAAWKRLPLAMANVLGPRIVRHIP